jgi:transcriptional regulator with XRE-family HTH domain
MIISDKKGVFYMTLGEKIQQLRKSKGFSQEELAACITISRQAISKWEMGESKPDIDNIIQISKLFGVSTDYLLIDDYDSNSNNKITQGSIEPEQKKPLNSTIRFIGGLCCTILPVIAIFIVWLLSKIYPAPIAYYNEVTKLWKVGLDNFVWVHGLESFMSGCYSIFIIGMILLLYKYIKELFIIIKTKFKPTKFL